MASLRNKVALVTGASRGIGEAIALALAKAGARVMAVARNGDLLRQTVGQINALGAEGDYRTCDLGNLEEVETLVPSTLARFGRIDILVNNAAYAPPVAGLAEESGESFQKTFQINVTAPFLLSRAAAAGMLENKWGRIINVASIAGVIGLNGQAAYCASKGALIQMTKVLALEWAGKADITVNAVAPGFVATDMNQAVRDNEKVYKSLARRIPARRFARSEETVGAVLYLASEEASFTNGSVLVVDGGMLAA